MHIPTSPTTYIDVLPFDEALQEGLRPHPDYDVAKWLYVPNRYDEYRYILGTRGKHPVICIGINPSTAAPDNLDPTLKSAQRIALANGYDSFLMFNVYAQRATRPDDMEKARNEWLHNENMKAFRYLLSIAGERPAVWAAWGSIIEKRGYLTDCVREMLEIGREADAVWLHAGPLSVKGHPHHPLYLKSDTPLEIFDTAAYLDGLAILQK
ncbi:MAG: DUF1643 domain-containing protein [Ruminococcaceae bacterium]|nr:DUF1643 domain-containing protein [Oscillospiraceae bacterium]